MTDEQIIKALELCKSDERGQCLNKCPYYNYSANCSREMISDALDLIIRQQKEIEAKQAHILCLKAEVERLTKELNNAIVENIGLFSTLEEKKNLIRKLLPTIAEIRTEAITEYHEEVKKRCIEGGIFPAFVERVMLNVKKEMVGEQQ